MADRLNIIVSCTNRKSRQIPNPLQLRSLAHLEVGERFEQWRERLDGRFAKPGAAKTLYQGDHWQVALALPKCAARNDIEARLWVCSAGYGLVPLEAELQPYAATFAAGHADSIYTGTEDSSIYETSSRWWELLTKWDGPEKKTPRSLTQLITQFSTDAFLFVGSETYLNAVRHDLKQAVSRISDPDRFLLISAGGGESPELATYYAPVDARYQSEVGGTLSALNVRVARLALQLCKTGEFSRSDLQAKLSVKQESLPAFRTFNRDKITDEDVIEFVQGELSDDGSVSKTALLRVLRDSGRACEQKRFFSLYRMAKQKLDDDN